MFNPIRRTTYDCLDAFPDSFVCFPTLVLYSVDSQHPVPTIHKLPVRLEAFQQVRDRVTWDARMFVHLLERYLKAAGDIRQRCRDQIDEEKFAVRAKVFDVWIIPKESVYVSTLGHGEN